MQDRMRTAVTAQNVREMSECIPRLEDYVEHAQTIEDMCQAAHLQQQHLTQQELYAEEGASQARAELHVALDQSNMTQIGTLTQAMQVHLDAAHVAAQRTATVATELETQLTLYLKGRRAAKEATPQATSKPPPPGWSMEPDPTPVCQTGQTPPVHTQQPAGRSLQKPS